MPLKDECCKVSAVPIHTGLKKSLIEKSLYKWFKSQQMKSKCFVILKFAFYLKWSKSRVKARLKFYKENYLVS